MDLARTAPRPAEGRPRDAREGDLRILVVIGHPREGSFCHALADAYVDSARAAGASVHVLVLSDLVFARDVVHPRIGDQPLEPDLAEAQALIRWADHLVFVYPTWWGTYPGLMKSFLDRVLLPGFAFVETDGLTGFAGRLNGKTAHLITTMDTPGPVYRLAYRNPGHNALARATLGFCGVGPVRITAFGPMRSATDEIRRRWIGRARDEGSKFRGAVPTAAGRLRATAAAWLRAVRLQFYPMTWAAYALGAVLAAGGQVFATSLFWLGYAALFLLEAAAVFINEIVDFSSDRRNRNYGVFTGGSRVLVDGALSRPALARAAGAALGTSCALALIAAFETRDPAVAFGAFAVLAVLGVGYTFPPLKLSWRTLGELDVAATHGPGVLVFGFLLFGGHVSDPAPWLLSLPLALAVLPAIVLAGMPDRDADAQAGKRTVAVRFGGRVAIAVAMTTTVLAAAAALALLWGWSEGDVYGLVALPIIAHAALLLWVLGRQLRSAAVAARIDGALVVALSYMVWFAAGPLIFLA